jgi:hypothetical protein
MGWPYVFLFPTQSCLLSKPFFSNEYFAKPEQELHPYSFPEPEPQQYDAVP